MQRKQNTNRESNVRQDHLFNTYQGITTSSHCNVSLTSNLWNLSSGSQLPCSYLCRQKYQCRIQLPNCLFLGQNWSTLSKYGEAWKIQKNPFLAYFFLKPDIYAHLA